MNNKGAINKVLAVVIAVIVLAGIVFIYSSKKSEKLEPNLNIPDDIPMAPLQEITQADSSEDPSKGTTSSAIISSSQISDPPTPKQTDIPSNPESSSQVNPTSSSVSPAPAGANSESTQQTPSPLTGNAIYINPPEESGGSWVIIQNQYMDYKNVWYHSSSGRLYAQGCWRYDSSINNYTYAQSCSIDLTNVYIYYNSPIFYQNFSEYVFKARNSSWTNNSWAYVIEGIWIKNSSSSWTYVGRTWIHFTNNWKVRINHSGLIGAWKHIVNESNIIEGKYHQDYFSSGRIFVKSASKANATAHYLINDTWINLAGAYGMYNSLYIVQALNFSNVNSYIYNWDTWYLGAENGWVWFGNVWQSWNHFWLWKSDNEYYYFDDSLVWVANAWKYNQKRIPPIETFYDYPKLTEPEPQESEGEGNRGTCTEIEGGFVPGNIWTCSLNCPTHTYASYDGPNGCYELCRGAAEPGC